MADGILKPLYREPIRHMRKLLLEESYRTYYVLASRLKRVPRHTPVTVRVGGLNLSVPDAASFLSTYKELFVERLYAFRARDARPAILDLGANIGLSVLFFKKLYPEARITALEADPQIFAYLKANVHGNGFTDVELVNKAAWHAPARLRFASDGADGGRLSGGEGTGCVEVDAVDVADFLRRGRYDFLKMDIEGAEEAVLPACAPFLPDIDHVFLEYHSRQGEKQCLAQLLNILSVAGHRVQLHRIGGHAAPFNAVASKEDFDLQLNIFAQRSAGE